MKKLLSVVVVLAMMLTLGAVQVFAAGEGQEIAYAEKNSTEVIADFDDMTKVTGTWDDSKEHQFEGKKLKISNDVSGNVAGLKVTGVDAGTYKVAYFFDVQDIGEETDEYKASTSKQDFRIRLNPNGIYVNMPYFPCEFNGIQFTGLSTAEGTKIIGVAVIQVTDDDTDIELLSHIGKGFMTGTLDRIVFAGADHNFMASEYSDYELFVEATAHDTENREVPVEGDWEPSEEVEDNKTDDNKTDDNKTDDNKTDDNKTDDNKDDNKTDDNKDDNKTDDNNDDNKDNNTGKDNVPQTADVSVVLAMVAAGAAAFGGLKLRKK